MLLFNVGSSRRSLQAAVTVFLVSAWLPMAGAQTADGAYTGASLLDDLKYCDTAPADYRCGRGATYIRGIVRRFAVRTGQADQGVSKKTFCIPSDTTIADLMSVVREYLDANPAQLAALGAWAVRDAILLQYPCD